MSGTPMVFVGCSNSIKIFHVIIDEIILFQ